MARPRIIRQKIGLESLNAPAETGIALLILHFMLRQFTNSSPISRRQLVAKDLGTGESLQALLQIPVSFPDQVTDVHSR